MKKAGIIAGIVLAVLLLLWLIKPLTWFKLGMTLDPDQQIWVTKEVPLSASVDEPVNIRILNPLLTTIRVLDPLRINLAETFDVPLIMELLVPFDTEFFMNDTLDLEFDLPVDLMLTQKEMPLNNLVIPFNQKLYIDDSLAVDFSIPMSSKLKAALRSKGKGIGMWVKGDIPVQAVIPIKQHLQVIDTIIMSAQDYNVPLRTIIPVKAQVPIKQAVRVSGELLVPVNQKVSIPLSKVVTTPVLSSFRAEVETNNVLSTGFESGLNATSSFTKPLTVTMEELTIDPSTVRILARDKKEK